MRHMIIYCHLELHWNVCDRSYVNLITCGVGWTIVYLFIKLIFRFNFSPTRDEGQVTVLSAPISELSTYMWAWWPWRPANSRPASHRLHSRTRTRESAPSHFGWRTRLPPCLCGRSYGSIGQQWPSSQHASSQLLHELLKHVHLCRAVDLARLHPEDVLDHLLAFAHDYELGGEHSSLDELCLRRRREPSPALR